MPENPDRKVIIVNTSPILSIIAALGSLDVLSFLYGRVLVPFEVCQEIARGGANGFAVKEFESSGWLEKQPAPLDIASLLSNLLDIGEAAVIQLALNKNIPLVGIDETVGRRIARLSGLSVTGSIGMLLRAKQLHYPISIKTAIKNMRNKGIWLSDRVAAYAMSRQESSSHA